MSKNPPKQQEVLTLNANRSWKLNIYVTDLQISKSIEVNSSTHIGQLMIDLVDKLDIQSDWSDHGIWWPEKKMWLVKPRVTLLTVGIIRDCDLEFTPMHKTVCLRMPDMQTLNMRVSFSMNVFNAVKEICADVGIRHPEEMSLLRPLDLGTRKKKTKKTKSDKAESQGSDDTASQGSLDGTLDRSKGPVSPGDRSDISFAGDSLNPYSTPLSPMLAHSSHHASNESLEMLGKGKTLQQKSELNAGWLYSNESLMEQDVKEYDTLLLRFKYYNFFDLNTKVDEVRINQIYEQAKYQILTEQVECTEDEAVMFAALMLQVQIAAQNPQGPRSEEVDDIDSALSELQMTLEGAPSSNNTTTKKPAGRNAGLTHIPEMKETLNLVLKKSLGMKASKPFCFQFKDTHISYYKEQSQSIGPPIQKFNIKDCAITPVVNASKDKFNIKLKIPGPDMSEIELACTSEEQYVRWMAACRLASKGKTMADPTYELEKSGARTFINLQRGNPSEDMDSSLGDCKINAENFISAKHLAKYKPKQIIPRIMEAQSTITYLPLIDVKMKFILNWKQLPDFGRTTFNCTFAREGSKRKEDILVLGVNEIQQQDPSSRQILRRWRYSAMKSWNVNWETRAMIVSIADQEEKETVGESDGSTQVRFSPAPHTDKVPPVDIRIIHEFIGGYVFLSMRKDVNAHPQDELFYKMTASGMF